MPAIALESGFAELESVCGRESTVGSNPTATATSEHLGPPSSERAQHAALGSQPKAVFLVRVSGLVWTVSL